MKLLVTGASGFVARHVLLRWQDRHDLTCVGRSGPTIPDFRGRTVGANFVEPGALERALALLEREPRFDAIVHLAVSRRHREFPESAADLFAVNLAAAASLLDFAYRTGVGHLVLGSTGSVYDQPWGHEAKETDLAPPKSYFAATKLAADSLAVHYRPYFAVSILRFFVPYGPGLDDRMLSNLATTVRRGDPVTVPLSGPPMSFAPIYGDDAVDVVDACVEKVWNRTVNVAGPEVLTLPEAAASIARYYGVETRVEPSPRASGAYLVPDLTALRQLVDPSRFTPFERGVRVMLDATAR